MIDILLNNPYRIVGVYSSANIREIKASISKAKAYSKASKENITPVDFPLLKQSADRTIDNIIQAESDITFPQSRLQYALFWFSNPNGIYENAFETLRNGDNKTFKRLISQFNEYSAFINLSTCALLEDDYTTSIKNMLKVVREYDLYERLLVDYNGSTSLLSQDEVWQLYVSNLYVLAPEADLIQCAINAGCYEDEILTFKNSQTESTPNNIQQEIRKAELTIESKDPKQIISAAEFLYTNTKKDLKQLEEVYAIDDPEYSRITNTVATKIKSLCVVSYNTAHDKILEDLDTFAFISEAVVALLSKIDTTRLYPQLTKDIKKDLETVSSAAKDPKEYLLNYIAGQSDICWYCGEKATTVREVSYSKSTTKHGAVTKTTTTTTRTVKFHVCPKCQQEHSVQGKLGAIAIILALIIELVVAYILCAVYKYYDYSFHWDFILWVGGINLFGGIYVTMFVAMPISLLLGLFRKKSERKFIRSEEDHPLVKKLRKSGF